VTAVLLAAIAVLILVNGFFVAAEFALVSARAAHVDGTSPSSRLARRQQGRLDEYLAACQLGITIASLALGAVGEPVFADLFERVLDRPLAEAAAVVSSILAIVVMTVFHITVGEQAPKSFAIGSAARVARLCAVPLQGFYWAFRPLVIVLNDASNGLVRLFGGTPASSHAQQASLEELRTLIGGLTEDGGLDEADAQLLQGVFTLDERRAADVMTPRPRVRFVREGSTARGALEELRDSGHSRFPLLDAAGRLRGIVYWRELTEALLDGEDDRLAETLRHEMFVVPPTAPLDAVLAQLQERRVAICAVVDEYGELDGVVTVEDILEELVGEIWDEDDLPTGIRVLHDGRVVCRGDVSVLDLEEFGVRLPAQQHAMSIGGAIQNVLGRLAQPGDRVQLGDVSARVLSTAERGQVKRVLLAVPAGVRGA
jgi:CBS domain containing-hemolysin-like protein